jgi:hypothetical protein
VRATNAPTGLKREAETGWQGSYFLSDLETGIFTIEVIREGFEPFRRGGVRLEVGRPDIGALQSGVAILRNLLRFVLVCHTLALFAQSVLAGEFLSGTDLVVKFHEWMAWIILGICAVQIVTAVFSQRTRDASLELLIGSVMIFLAEVLQTGTGYGRFLRVHIPIGVITFAGVSWQLIAQLRRHSLETVSSR